MEYVLVTQSLSKHYKNFKALDGLTMHVPRGSIYGFVGRNGAGKTTTASRPSAAEWARWWRRRPSTWI